MSVLVKNSPEWFRTRVFRVIAIKWDGSDETYAEVRNFIGPALLARQVYCGGLIIDTRGGDALVRRGDYIVRALDGTFVCIEGALFENTHDALFT